MPGVDMRSPSGRRFRDLVAGFAEELGGVEALGHAELALVRQAAMEVLRIELLQGALMRGKRVDHAELTRAGNCVSRVLGQLGVKRQAHDTTPSLAEYLAANHSEAVT
jgi:hypothetical protein